MPAGIHPTARSTRCSRPMRPAASARRCMRWSPDISPSIPGAGPSCAAWRPPTPPPWRPRRRSRCRTGRPSSRRSSPRPPPARPGRIRRRTACSRRRSPASWGSSLDRVRWRTLLPGIKAFRIEEAGRGEAALYWIRPGRRMLAHTHEGCEYTLVLKGGFADSVGHYRRGDIAIADHEIDHRAAGGRGRGLHLLHGHRRAPAADRAGRADRPAAVRRALEAGSSFGFAAQPSCRGGPQARLEARASPETTWTLRDAAFGAPQDEGKDEPASERPSLEGCPVRETKAKWPIP